MEASKDASFSHGADAEDANNASYKCKVEPKEEEEENNEAQASSNMAPAKSFTKTETSTEKVTSYSKYEQEHKTSCTDSSEAKMRELNERLLKTIQSLQRENHKLKFKVDYLQKKEEEKTTMVISEERNYITKIEQLKSQNSKKDQRIVELQTRLDMEIKMRTEAEKRINDYINKAESYQYNDLQQHIEKLESKITSLKKEQTKKLEEWRVTIEKDSFGKAGDTVDGTGEDFWCHITKMKKELIAIIQRIITDVEEACSFEMLELEKTVTKKESELTQSYENYSGHIQEYLRQISSLTTKIQEKEELRQHELVKSKEIIEVSKEKLKTIKSVFHHQTVNTDILLQAEIITYDSYLAILEARAKSGKSLNGDKDDLKSITKRLPGCFQNSSFQQNPDPTSEDQPKSDCQGENEEDDQGHGRSPGTMGDDPSLQNSESALVGQTESDLKGENEEDDQGHGRSPGTVRDDPSLQKSDPTSEDQPKSDPEADSEKDNQGHGRSPGTMGDDPSLQNPDSALVGQTESDPKSDNEGDNQESDDSDGDDDSDEDSFNEGQLY